MPSIKVCGYSDCFCKNLNQRSLTPRWPLTPHLLRSHVWLYPRIIVSKSMGIHQCMWIEWSILQITNQRSLTPRWPLTPHLLRSHVWLYPRIIVSKSHENTLQYVDTVNLFAKTWTKGHWPIDNLWLHICWGHSTQGSLCPSPMGIRQRSYVIIGFVAPAIGPNKSKKFTRLISPTHNIRSKVWMKNNIHGFTDNVTSGMLLRRWISQP